MNKIESQHAADPRARLPSNTKTSWPITARARRSDTIQLTGLSDLLLVIKVVAWC